MIFPLAVERPIKGGANALAVRDKLNSARGAGIRTNNHRRVRRLVADAGKPWIFPLVRFLAVRGATGNASQLEANPDDENGNRLVRDWQKPINAQHESERDKKTSAPQLQEVQE